MSAAVPTPPASKPDHDALAAAQGDAGPGPRPRYEGDWNSASGSAKGRHSERVRQWKAEVERVAQSQAGAGSSQPAASVGLSAPADAHRATLIAIRDDASAHDSDRIRAAQALIALDRDAAQAQGAGPSHLVALRQVLDTLQPHERLAWLQGERVAGMRAQATRVGAGAEG